MTIHFPDLSNHQGKMSIAGAVALISKATEGTTFRDSTFTYYRDQAAAAGIPYAAYHWLHRNDVPGQARNAFAVVGPNIPLMIDDEDTGDGLDVNRTLTFVQEYRRLGGTVTLEYLPKWFWQQNGSPDLRPLANAGLSLISSHYTTYSDNGPGWQPYGGMTPTIWQYTSSQPWNGNAKTDFNAFKGTVDELRAVFGGVDMTPHQAQTLHAVYYYLERGVLGLQDPIKLPPDQASGYPGYTLPNTLAKKLAELDAQIEALAAASGLDPAALKAAVQEAVHAEVPAIADAVVDEEAKRLED